MTIKDIIEREAPRSADVLMSLVANAIQRTAQNEPGRVEQVQSGPPNLRGMRRRTARPRNASSSIKTLWRASGRRVSLKLFASSRSDTLGREWLEAKKVRPVAGSKKRDG